MITWMPVESEWIAAVSYDSDARRLTIRAKNGREYTSEGIPQSLYDEFMLAGSKGKFWRERIKNR